MTVNKQQIKSAIDNAETSYFTCFNFLCLLKKIKNDNNPLNVAFGLVNFQLLLSKSLYNIESQYRLVKKEFKDINIRRNTLTQIYFKNRLKTLEIYLQSLERTIVIGKSIGDAFIWFFYQFDQNLIVNHLNSPVNIHPTPGPGGEAELAFLSNALLIKKRYFTIYHGITNILRIGDFTVFDLKTLRINETVELKSKKLSNNCYQMSLYTFGKKKSFIHSPKIKASYDNELQITEEIYKDRLERQINDLRSLMKEQKLSLSKDKLIMGSNYIYDIEKHLDKIKSNEVKHIKLGDGLIATCSNIGNSSMFKLFINGLKIKDMDLKGLQRLVNETMTDMKELNQPLFSTVLYNDKFVNFHPGTMPLFWYKIKSDILKKIYFRQIIITTAYNPAVFVKELMKIGFKFKIEKKQLVIYKVENNLILKLENYMYFVDLISMYLLKESSVLEIISKTIKKANNEDLKFGKIVVKVNTFMEL